MFVNNIILCKDIDIKNSISDTFKDVQKEVASVLANQPYPYEFLQKNLDSDSSLLDVMFTYQNENSNLSYSGVKAIGADTRNC